MRHYLWQLQSCQKLGCAPRLVRSGGQGSLCRGGGGGRLGDRLLDAGVVRALCCGLPVRRTASRLGMCRLTAPVRRKTRTGLGERQCSVSRIKTNSYGPQGVQEFSKRGWKERNRHPTSPCSIAAPPRQEAPTSVLVLYQWLGWGEQHALDEFLPFCREMDALGPQS